MPTLKLTNAKRMSVRMDNGRYSPVVLKDQTLEVTAEEATRLLKDGYRNVENEFRSYWTDVTPPAPEPTAVAKTARRSRKATEDVDPVSAED